MSGAVIPQWKIALQQKLEKKKEDERRKLMEEENRRLDALPPWKRMGMVPQNVIIISGGTKTVSKLSTDAEATTGEKTQKEPSQTSQVAKTTTTKSTTRPTTTRTESESRPRPRTTVVNVQHQTHENHVGSSHKETPLTNHLGEDDKAAGKPSAVAGREGVDEEHVSSVSENPFLKFDGGGRRCRVSPIPRNDDKVQAVTSSATEHKTTDSVRVAKKQPDNSIRQRSRSASPRRAAKEHKIDVRAAEEDMPQTRPRKNSVSDLRSRYGRAASVNDLKIVSRKTSDSEITSPLSPQSPTLNRDLLFDKEPHKVHITFKPETTRSPSPTSVPKGSPTASSVTPTCTTLPSTQPQTPKSSVEQASTASKQSEAKPVTNFTEAKIVPTAKTNNSTKRQAPKAPTTSESSSSTKSDVIPAKTITTSSSRSSSHAVESVNGAEKSNKPLDSSKTRATTNDVSLPDQPKTAILGDGQSSLRRRKGASKMSASALISLSSNDSGGVQLTEHNARVRAARQEARTSSSKNLLRSARDGESKDTDSIPNGSVSSNAFGSKIKTAENQTNSTTKPKEDTQFVDSIPYPENFRQPKKESTYVDPIPYPEHFRKPKSNNQETSASNAPSNKVVPAQLKKPAMDDIPRSNIDELILSPIDENLPSTLTNGTVEVKAPPKKIKKKSELEWIGYNTPTGKPSALKSASTSRKVEEKGLTISFNESNLSETYEYQSEASLLNEYLREERGLNGNPRIGNLPRQEARVEEEDDVIDSTPSAQSGIDNVLAHEGLQSYTPKDLQEFSPMSIRLQQQQREAPKAEEETAPSLAREEPGPGDDIAITYDDTGDYFSSAGSSSAALLF